MSDDPQMGLITEPVTITILPREDGGIRVQCDELPGLLLSGKNAAGVMAGILPSVKALREYPAIHGGKPTVNELNDDLRFGTPSAAIRKGEA